MKCTCLFCGVTSVIDKGRSMTGKRAYRCTSCKRTWQCGYGGRRRVSKQRLGDQFSNTRTWRYLKEHMKTEATIWKMFAFDNCGCIDWYVARTMDEAIKCNEETIGEKLGEDIEITEVGETGLNTLKYVDEDKNYTCSFREELDRMIAEGITEPVMFASTEY